jgi:hypothetical protein
MLSPISLRAALVGAIFSAHAFAGVTVKTSEDRATIAINDQPFTEYRFTGSSHVYYWPLLGPDGVKMTRSWPMEDVAGEEHDHPHHRSLWFAHGAVNGVDFWSEEASHPAGKGPKGGLGKIVHTGFVSAKSGDDVGELVTAQDWVAPDGSIPVKSQQTLRVYNRPANERLFDFEITLTAGDKAVVFGDTKEGTCALRIAESMRLKMPKAPGEGHIVNDTGITDGKVWGLPAKWVDMSGSINGKTYGIAFFEHPSNFRHPTRWHARDYGLFAANPFCGYEMDKKLEKGSGDYTLKAGEKLTLKYRLLLHEGDAAAAKVADRFFEYTYTK